jgi:hypothetical protein
LQRLLAHHLPKKLFYAATSRENTMSNFTQLAQQAFDRYHNQSSAAQWNLKDALRAIMPFLQTHGGNLDAMPGLRQAFQQAEAQELQAMWTEYCHLGDLLYTLQRELQE